MAVKVRRQSANLRELIFADLMSCLKLIPGCELGRISIKFGGGGAIAIRLVRIQHSDKMLDSPSRLRQFSSGSFACGVSYFPTGSDKAVKPLLTLQDRFHGIMPEVVQSKEDTPPIIVSLPGDRTIRTSAFQKCAAVT